jgi:hypothetical protein
VLGRDLANDLLLFASLQLVAHFSPIVSSNALAIRIADLGLPKVRMWLGRKLLFMTQHIRHKSRDSKVFDRIFVHISEALV